jgi:A/G-specific adenine glycosylase
VKSSLGAQIIRWHQRASIPTFPWRLVDDPYKVLVAVMLLRRTTREQALKLFPEFIDRYPDPGLLAKAPLPQIRKFLRPLGLVKARSRDLKGAATILSRRDFPSTLEELRQIPGVGSYTAATVLCIAFGMDIPMIDVNSTRVLSRIFEGRDDVGQRRVSELFRKVGRGDARELNLALLDFAHYVCTARDPKCPICPVKRRCRYYRDVLGAG